MSSGQAEQPASQGPHTPPRRRLLGKLGILAVIAVPWIATGAMLATGRIWANGDNLIQSYPLRVLVGLDIHHGQLPLWNPFIWSGTPLLAGFNAGAGYPTTLLFGFLPPTVAWAVNQALPYSVAALGLYLFLRMQRLSEASSTLAAASFSLCGFMIAQNVHLDLLEAASWLPWTFLAIDRIARRPKGAPSWPWILLFAGSSGLMILAGAPEAPLDSMLPLGIFAVWSACRSQHPRWRVIGACVAGGVGGVWLSCAQWFPGLLFQLHSQRAPINYGYFTSGSLRPALSLLSFAPYILGGTRSSPLGYPSQYNLVEVAGYSGILTMIATFALIGRWRHKEAREWRVWFIILVVGLLLAWGGYTPLGLLMYHLPGYNKQRLLSRNLLEVDLAACVLFGYWCNSLLNSRPWSRYRSGGSECVAAADTGATFVGTNGPPGGILERRLSVTPVAVAVAVYLAFVALGPILERSLAVLSYTPSYSSILHLDLRMLPSLVIACAAGLLAWKAWGMPRRRLSFLLTLIMVLDLGMFSVNMVAFPRPQSASRATSPLGAELARATPGGRVATYDPKHVHFSQMLDLSQPDLNVLRKMASVQGYGAIVSSAYNSATHSHSLLQLWPAGLKGSTFDKLNLQTLLVPRYYFLRHKIPQPKPQTPPAPGALAPLPPLPTSFFLTPGRPFTWYFGEPLRIKALKLPVLDIPSPRQITRTQHAGTPKASLGSHQRGPEIRIGLLATPVRTASNQRPSIVWIARSSLSSSTHSIDVHLANTVKAIGLVALLEPTPLASISPTQALQAQASSSANSGKRSDAEVGIGELTTSEGASYFLDGELQGFIMPNHWAYIGMDGSFAMFHNTHARGPAWALTKSGAPDPLSRPRIVTSTPWGTTVIDVNSRTPINLVWSETYADGWRANISKLSNRPVLGSQIAVHRHGLVQEVAVPAGPHRITFSYHRTADIAAIIASLAALLAGILLLAAGIATRAWKTRVERGLSREP